MLTAGKTFSPTLIDTYRDGGIRFAQPKNLLDQQIMAAFKSCLENDSINHVEFLQNLERIAKEGKI